MNIKAISPKNRQQVNDFISSRWFSTEMFIKGQKIDMTALDGFVIYDDNQTIIGLVTYIIKDNECEIISLDSIRERQGIGTALLNKAIETAKQKKCTKIKLTTTNDNLNAMRFYQKRGFDMTKIYPNALDISRKLKPTIPLIGDFGIPLKHEIEFEMDLLK